MSQDDGSPCVESQKLTNCAQADRAAQKAVKDVFAILGVDIDNPEKVEEFRKSLRFGDQVRKVADKGIFTVVVAAITIVTAAILAKFGFISG